MYESNDILTSKKQIDSINVLTKDQEDLLTSCIEALTKIKTGKKITEASWREVSNVWREIDALRELFYVRILNSLKRGDMVLR